MVRGLWIQRSGAGSRGDEGPNAPMVLGTKIRKQFSRARSNTLCSPEERGVRGGNRRRTECGTSGIVKTLRCKLGIINT